MQLRIVLALASSAQLILGTRVGTGVGSGGTSGAMGQGLVLVVQRVGWALVLGGVAMAVLV